MTDIIVAILKVLTWSHTIPIALVVISLILRKPLADLISRVRSAHGEGRKWGVDFLDPGNRTSASLPNPGQTIVTQEQVKAALETIIQLDPGTVARDYKKAHTHFLQRGVVTEVQLQDLSKSTEVIDTLANIYITLLGRSEKHPLDAVGFAIFGSILFAYGCDRHVVAFIEQQIRNSPEYRDKHRRPNN
ncbi:MAG: hypothetical protein HYV35_09355 [Lentisphaerae bacterium]|nr:hypothetical protein [Lentisphaerota bacterium]